MEVLLNLVWLALAVMLLTLWRNHAPRQASSWTIQFTALTVLLLLLLPVISASDDIALARNPAEIETVLRRTSSPTQPHSILPVPGLATQTGIPALAMTASYEELLPEFSPQQHSPFWFFSLQNRPPPAL
jgi:hypothetical protein